MASAIGTAIILILGGGHLGHPERVLELSGLRQDAWGLAPVVHHGDHLVHEPLHRRGGVWGPFGHGVQEKLHLRVDHLILAARGELYIHQRIMMLTSAIEQKRGGMHKIGV